jgi:hypothetical protein
MLIIDQMLSGLYYKNRVYSANRLKDKNCNNVGTAIFTVERDLGPNGGYPQASGLLPVLIHP